MIQSAMGIILRTRPLRETSVIVQWLTPEFGRTATVAKGARESKSPFRGKLDLFFQCEFSFSRSRSSELHTLREVALRETHSALRHDLILLQQASYAAALIEQTTETDTPLPEIFDLFGKFLHALLQQPPKARTIFTFELKLLRLLGLEPIVTETTLSAETQKLVSMMLESDWKKLGELQATQAHARELFQFLHGFLIYHLGKFPKGRAAALLGDN